MATIHPTAVVGKNVQLDEDVVVGPYCIVGDGVSVGAGTVLEAHVIVAGRVTMGRGNRLFPNSVVGCWPQALGMGADTEFGELIIGDRNTIRENVTIHLSKHAGTATRLGSDNLLMVGSHLGHDCVVEDKVVLSNYVQIAGHVKIETGAWISGMAGCHQFVTVGQWAFIAGLAGVTRDVPPFLIVSGHYPSKVRGVNKRGLARAGMNEQQQERIYEAYKKLYRRGSTLLANARELAAQDGLDENVRALVEAVSRTHQHRFGRYQETFRD